VFEKTCAELEERTSLDRLAVRGTVRIALKDAGLDAQSVDPTQMRIVLGRVLPGELERRGIDDAAAVCEAIVKALAGLTFEVGEDRAGAAADAIGRFGS
jgi:hypothetical protein